MEYESGSVWAAVTDPASAHKLEHVLVEQLGDKSGAAWAMELALVRAKESAVRWGAL